MEVSQDVLRTMQFRFPQRVRNAVDFQNSTLALDVYTAAERVPSNTTGNEISAGGYQMNGPLYDGSDLITCFKGGKMYIVKGLRPDEYERAQIFLAAFRRSYPPHIITFELQTSSKGKSFMIMPAMRYPVDKRPKPYLTSDDVCLLWPNLRDALKHIHSGGFAFMDIKPANICFDDAGYFLVDLGSIVPFGGTTSSTEAYVPSDLIVNPARAEVDWWMLGATLAEFGCGIDGLHIGFGNRRFSRREIISTLEAHLPGTVYVEFRSIIDSILH